MTRLPADYLADAEKRARRYMGQWTGTAGSLAADVIRLLKERAAILQEHAAMSQQLEDANAKLREAIAARREAVAAGKPAEQWYDAVDGGCCSGGKCHSPENVADDDDADATVPTDWILQGQRELEASTDDIRWSGDSILAQPADGLRPGSSQFVSLLDEIKELHLRKTLDYGIDDDALSNIRESAEIVNMPAWAGCILRIYDKMHRLKAYFRRGRVEFDGLSDTLMDIASYAVIAEVLRREADPVKRTA